MPVTEPNRPMSTAPKPAWMPSPKSLLIAGIAFLVGLLLFLMLWLDQRDNNRFYRSLEAPRSVAGQVFDPLPVPLPSTRSMSRGLPSASMWTRNTTVPDSPRRCASRG